MVMKKLVLALAVGLAAISPAGQALAGKDLDVVKARGQLICGVAVGGIAGFMTVDSQGKWTGMNVDICRGISAALFGDSEKVKYVPLSGQQRFTALQAGEVDLLSSNSTWTLTRDTALGLDFVGITYYDGQGFMVPKKLGVKSAKELNGASICVLTGSTSELNIADYFRTNKMTFKPVLFEDPEPEPLGLLQRPLRRLFRRPGPPCHARGRMRPIPTTMSFCRRSSPRNRWARWCAMATTSGPTSCAGCSTP